MEDPIAARLKNFIVNSNDALEFKLIRYVEDIDNNETTFKPNFSHQVFGQSESIFGFRDLRIKLYYSAGSLETYLGMTYSEKVNKALYEGVEADEVLPKVAEYLAPHVHNNIDTFIESLKKDDKFKPHGEMFDSFCIEDENGLRKFEIYKPDMTSKGFIEYHKRIRTFILWYIDAGSFIDIDDDRWNYFIVFEKYQTTDGNVRYASVGFAHIYQYFAYPNHIRPRISQILILPPFQRMGLGKYLLQAVYRYYIGRKDVIDITVEDPSMNFQRLRDYVDALNCSRLPSFSSEHLLQGFSKAMAVEAKEKLKINMKQARRVYEILRLNATDLSNEKEYREYRLNIKKRLNIPYKREQNELKRLERLKNTEKYKNIPLIPTEQRMQILEQEYKILEEEYAKVVERLRDEKEP